MRHIGTMPAKSKMVAHSVQWSCSPSTSASHKTRFMTILEKVTYWHIRLQPIRTSRETAARMHLWHHAWIDLFSGDISTLTFSILWPNKRNAFVAHRIVFAVVHWMATRKNCRATIQPVQCSFPKIHPFIYPLTASTWTAVKARNTRMHSVCVAKTQPSAAQTKQPTFNWQHAQSVLNSSGLHNQSASFADKEVRVRRGEGQGSSRVQGHKATDCSKQLLDTNKN